MANTDPPLAQALDSIDEFLLSGTEMEMASSNVKTISYVYDEQTLQVTFLNGAVYNYYGVPAAVARGFVATPSPGRYVWNELRDVYRYTRVSGPSGKKGRSRTIRKIHGLSEEEKARLPVAQAPTYPRTS